MPALTKIDEPLLREHSSLSQGDDCYFLLEYTAHSSIQQSPDNTFITNLKKKPDRKNKWEWPYKEWTIQQLAAELATALPTLIDFPTTTLIPIPPSRIRTSPLYDDRVLQVLRQACPADADIREPIICREDRLAAHHSQEHDRPAINDLMDNYSWLEGAHPLRPNTVLFDDVITSGNHYIACKRFVLQHHPATRVTGIFIARRALKRPRP